MMSGLTGADGGFLFIPTTHFLCTPLDQSCMSLLFSRILSFSLNISSMDAAVPQNLSWEMTNPRHF